MRESIDLNPVLRYYNALLDKHRDDSRAAGWRNRESQYRKFFEITRVFEHDAEPFSVYDVGCGLAGLHEFLKETNPLARYKGCDINPRMIERARRAVPEADIEWRDVAVAPPSIRYDYVVASGTFSIRGRIAKSPWTVYVTDMLRVFFQIARRGIAVGFLSSFASAKVAGEYYAEPAELLDFAQRRLSPLAEIRHSLSPGHFALFVLKGPR